MTLTNALAVLGPAIGGAGAAVALVLALLSPRFAPGRWLRARAHALDNELRFLRTRVKALQVLALAGCGCLFVFGLTSQIDLPALLPLAAVPFWLPGVVVRALRRRRAERIEAQLDGWLLCLANALRANPSLAAALSGSAGVTRDPMRAEIVELIKAYRLGTPLGEALRELAGRVPSATLSMTLAALRVASNSGGELPRTLETMAASLREAARLEGVLKSKTAEARVQAVVVAVLPFLVMALLYVLAPQLITPLLEDTMGHLVIGLALILWLAAVLTARKVLATAL
ncbi:MAG: type II secretion system F family protein [Proteobacteria bacterium]|nr:type II secretion system F family protein [Pseudomonadota bacterium]